MQPETELDEYTLEDCHLYQAENFITTSMSYNEKLGKLAVLKKRASANKNKNQLFLVEIYNAIDLPYIFLEKSHPISGASVEAIVWMDDQVIGACFDGSLFVISPFTTFFKHFQITPSPIWCMTVLLSNQIAVGTDSGFVFFVERDLEVPEGEVSLFVKKSFHLASSVKLSKIAAGSLDKIYLLEMGRPENQKVMPLTQENAKSTVPWALVFANESLLCGDSRGKLTIYNAKTGALLKTISTHEADILTMCFDGSRVFAAGIDPRIQILQEIEYEDRGLEWATVGQRLKHSKEVRALTCMKDGWIISGGIEPRLNINNIKHIFHTISKPEIIVTPNFNYLLFGYSNSVELWHRFVKLPTSEEPLNKKSKIIVAPKKICRLEFGSKCISHSTLSHDAQYIYACTPESLLVYRVRKDVFKSLKNTRHKKSIAALRKDQDTIKKFGEVATEESITAVVATHTALWMACGQFSIKKVTIKENELKETTFLKRDASSVRILRVNQGETMLVAMTLKNLVVVVDISSKGSKANEETIRTIQLEQLVLDCQFFTNSSLILLHTDLQSKLMLRSIESGKPVNQPISNSSLFKKKTREIGVSLSPVFNGRVVVAGSQGNFAVISELDQEKRLVKYEDRSEATVENFSTPERYTTPLAFLTGKTVLLC